VENGSFWAGSNILYITKIDLDITQQLNKISNFLADDIHIWVLLKHKVKHVTDWELAQRPLLRQGGYAF
jgi:hypothetical protein